MLCVTGHSLEGALAELACFWATVCFGQEGHPVTCVTITSPWVGDNNFWATIQMLGRKSLLHFLAVSNKHDLVTLAPNQFCSCDFCHLNQFCQEGIQLKLSAKSFTTAYHPEKNDTSYWGRILPWNEMTQRNGRVGICSERWRWMGGDVDRRGRGNKNLEMWQEFRQVGCLFTPEQAQGSLFLV